MLDGNEIPSGCSQVGMENPSGSSRQPRIENTSRSSGDSTSSSEDGTSSTGKSQRGTKRNQGSWGCQPTLSGGNHPCDQKKHSELSTVPQQGRFSTLTTKRRPKARQCRLPQTGTPTTSPAPPATSSGTHRAPTGRPGPRHAKRGPTVEEERAVRSRTKRPRPGTERGKREGPCDIP